MAGKNRRTCRTRQARRGNSRLYAWYFGYYVFDLDRVRSLTLRRPYGMLPPGEYEHLTDDGRIDRDAVDRADETGIATLARIVLPDGERYVLVDGYEIAAKCARLALPLRLRVLSRRESRACLHESTDGLDEKWSHE